MGQFGAGGSVFGATAGAEPGNFHVLLSHVATLELLGGVEKKRGKWPGAAVGRASDVSSRRGAEEPEKTVSAPTRQSRVSRQPAHRRRLPC